MAGDININGLFDNLFSFGSKFIEDKDKRNEFNMEIANAKVAFNTTLISTKTTPKADAFVKVLYAFIPFFRPIGSAVMTGFGIYLHLKEGMDISTASQLMLDGAFPAWIASRHVEKSRK